LSTVFIKDLASCFAIFIYLLFNHKTRVEQSPALKMIFHFQGAHLFRKTKIPLGACLR